MQRFTYRDYSKWFDGTEQVPSIPKFEVVDDLNGFDQNFRNRVLDAIVDAGKSPEIVSHIIFDKKVYKNYPSIKLKFSSELQENYVLWFYDSVKSLKHLNKDFDNFICSFNGSIHISRYLLTSALDRFGWFNEYVTKNFTIDADNLDGIIQTYCGESERLHRKFILPKNPTFYNTIRNYNYDSKSRFDHNNNIATLEPYLSKSFLHIVSETNGTSYQPFVSEKPFYSILTKGLWLSYAAPGYHTHFEKCYGFKKFTIFNYDFDKVENPVLRLIELLSSVSKFSKLTKDEWHDLYSMEKETLDFNYNHYLSRDYCKFLQKYDNTLDI